MDSNEAQYAAARQAQDERHHDERLRFDIWRHIYDNTSASSPLDFTIGLAAIVYASITGREWARTPQDAP